MNLGTISVDGFGNKTVTNMLGLILGYYNASSNITTDPSGRILYQGDMASVLLVLFR